MTGYQWFIIVIATTIMATEGYDIQAMAFTANSVMNDFQIGSTELGFLLSAGFIGIAVGAVSAGPFADRYGRRPVLLIALLINGLGLLLTATADSASEVFIWRLITGIGIGAAMNPISVIVSEYSNAKSRALALSIFATGFSIGGAVGGAVSPQTISAFGWQGVFVIGGILTAVVIVITAIAIPESLVYLSANRASSRSDKATARMVALARKLKLETASLDQAHDSTNTDTRIGSYKELFTPKYRGRTVSLWIIALAVMGTFYFVTTWTPQLLTRVGMTEEQGITVSTLLLSGGVIGTLSFGFLSTKWDVRRVSSVFLFASAVLAIVFILNTQYLMSAMLVGLALGVVIGANASIYYSLTPMTYPEAIRATGAGAAATVGRLATIVAPMIVGVLLDAGVGPTLLFAAVAVALVIGGIATWNHTLEQRHAKSVVSNDEAALAPAETPVP